MSDPFFKPVSGFDLPRFAGVPTFMRLPHVPLEAPKIFGASSGTCGSLMKVGTPANLGKSKPETGLKNGSLI